MRKVGIIVTIAAYLVGFALQPPSYWFADRLGWLYRHFAKEVALFSRLKCVAENWIDRRKFDNMSKDLLIYRDTLEPFCKLIIAKESEVYRRYMEDVEAEINLAKMSVLPTIAAIVAVIAVIWVDKGIKPTWLWGLFLFPGMLSYLAHRKRLEEVKMFSQMLILCESWTKPPTE